MASNTGSSEDADMKRTVEIQNLLHQKADEINEKLTTMAESIKVCDAVLNDLHALKDVLVSKSQDVCLKPKKETEEPPPKTSP